MLGGVGVGAHVQLAPVGAMPERRPDLLAVDHEVVAVAHGAGAQRRQVGARLRLRHALAPDVVGAHHAGEQLALLRVGAVVHDRRRDVVHADHVERHGSSRLRGLLGVDQLLEHGRSAAAVLLRPRHRAPASVGQRRVPCPQRVEGVGVAPAAPVRVPDLVGQIRRRATCAAPCGTARPPPGMRSPRCPVRDRADWFLYNFR